MEKNEARVSVIMPVCNAERYMRQSLDSVLAQTLGDIEVLCVDDGSTDASLDILQEYQRADSRLKIIQQSNKGGGAARNAGLAVARGDFLAFLDADDFFEPVMLERAVEAMVPTDADIAIFRALVYDVRISLARAESWLYRDDWVPDADVFSSADMPDHIFNAFSNVPWNKLFRHAFVREHGLRFQEIMRTNDLYFVCRALVLAKKIVTIDEYLVNYRVGTNMNCQASNDRFPLDFYRAFAEFRNYLVQQGLYKRFERSFVNHALDGIIANIASQSTQEGFNAIYEAIHSEIEPNFSILSHDASFFYDQGYLSQYCEACSATREEFLFSQYHRAKQERNLAWREQWREESALHQRIRLLEADCAKAESASEKAQSERDRALDRLREIEESTSFKVGWGLTTPLRFVKDSLAKNKERV